MTFLSDSPLDFKLKEEIREELRAYGLTAKPEKDKYYRRGCPKSVTGVIANKKTQYANPKRKEAGDFQAVCRVPGIE